MTDIKIGMKDEYCCRNTEYRLYDCKNVSTETVLKVNKLSRDTCRRYNYKSDL